MQWHSRILTTSWLTELARDTVVWSELQSTTEGSLQVQDVFTYTGATGATTAAQTDVPMVIDQGIRLPVAGTGDYNVDGAVRYSPTNSKLEMYYNGAWNTASGGTAFGPTPPSPATEGDVWYDTDNGRSYVYYYDGTSAQWVEMNPAWDGGTPPSSIGTTEIADESVTPAKLASSGLIDYNSSSVGIGEPASSTVPLVIRRDNNDGALNALRLSQSVADGTTEQVTKFRQEPSTGTTKILVENDNSLVTPTLTIAAGTEGNVASFDQDGLVSIPGTLNAGDVNITSGNLTLSDQDPYITSSNDQHIRIRPGGTAAKNIYLLPGLGTTGEAGGIVIGGFSENNGGRIYFRGRAGDATYRFAKSGQSSAEGMLSFESITADRTFTFPNVTGTIALTSSKVANSALLDSIDSTQFVRSDADDNISANTEWQDTYQARFGNSADLRISHTSNDNYISSHNGHIYIDSEAGGGTTHNTYMRKDGVTSAVFGNAANLYYLGVEKLDTEATGVRLFDDIYPSTDGVYSCGTSSDRWSHGYFDNVTVTSTVTVRGAIDLADDDNLRFGSSDDVKIYYNANNNLYVNMVTAGNIIFQDNGASKIVLEDSGIFRPSGSATSGTSIGSDDNRWDHGYFDNVSISSALVVRGTIDLADNDILRFGSGDDAEFLCNGSHFYLDLNSGIGNFYIRDGTTIRYTFNDNGTFTATGSVVENSDISLKENIEVIPNALSKLSEIRGVTYNRKDMEDNPRHAGVIAQEVEAVLPEVVETDEDTGIKSVAYGSLISLVIEATKELKEENSVLKAQNEALEARLAAIEASLGL